MKTEHLPMPSTQVANRPSVPKTRFLYPLAAVCVAALLMSPTSGEAQTGSTIMAARATTGDDIGADKAFMKAQYEPVIRKHHAAQKAFDAFYNAKIAEHCPTRDQYARFGSAWRYEPGQFVEPSALASWNVETNVVVTDEAYAPQEGRYRFDFSKVRMTFDEAKVDAAIKSACERVHAAGRDFLAKVDPVIAQKDWDNAFKLEGWAKGRLSPIRHDLKIAMNKLSPGDFSEIQLALMNGARIS
jgi:hypothetical protein